MKKIGISLATLALSASASALIAPGHHVYEHKTYCLSIYEEANGAKYLGGCDESANNQRRGAHLNSAGCAHGQAALEGYRTKGSKGPFSPVISSCIPPNVAQL